MKYGDLIDFLNDIDDVHVNAFGAVGDAVYLDVTCKMKPKIDRIVTTLTICPPEKHDETLNEC